MPREFLPRASKIVLAIAIFAAVLAASISPAAAAPVGAPGFDQYLVEHQADLGPFLQKDSGEILRQGVPLFLQWLGGVMLLTLVLSWGMDVFLGRGFAALFAPALGKWQRAIIYATGALVLTVVIFLLLAFTIVVVAGAPHLLTMLAVVVVLFALIGAGVQVAWIYFLYRTDVFIAVLFYLFLIVVHGFTGLVISVPMLGSGAGLPATSFVDRSITPRLQDEVAATRAELAAVTPANDQAASEATQLEDRIGQAREEETTLKNEIEEQKSSEAYLFSQIVKVHARGDLAGARDQLTALLTKFPGGTLSGLIRGQLTQVTSELAAQMAQQQQATAAAAQALAQTRADLLARAGRGQVTLSEMRRVLFGKTRAQVGALLGPPTETASDRWGFSQQMILNPVTNAHSGLAVYFMEGNVQSVDYYYGGSGQ